MKSLLTNAILAALLCVATLTGYYFWYSMIEAKSTEVAAIESKIDANTASETRIASTKQSLSQIADYETSIQSYFVPETDVVAFIDHLQAEGTGEGTTVDVLSVAKGGTSVRPTLSLSLSVKGTFDAVMRTIGVIEYDPHALTISNLSLQHDDKDAWHAQLDIVVGSISSTAAAALTTGATTTAPVATSTTIKAATSTP